MDSHFFKEFTIRNAYSEHEFYSTLEDSLEDVLNAVRKAYAADAEALAELEDEE